ncbi:glucose-6-phosphate isomerase [Neisseria sp.]|uniref:glucose-6-phosphate isomerase n=1 Tax=Neisseria sp. TaxID=192066 RepID=UPI00359F8D76
MDISQTGAWRALEAHSREAASFNMRRMFEADGSRFDTMHETLHGFLFDYSKNIVTEETLQLLCRLAEAGRLKERAAAMRAGEKINTSERRAVLHTALRLPADAAPVMVDGENVVPQVHRGLDRALAFAESLISGAFLGATGKRITDFVHIGIGGSDLGPRMAVQALEPYLKKVRVHFIGNADDSEISHVLKGLDSETTVFCIASKSFGTAETLLNAHAARAWFREQGRAEADIARHFVAVSSDINAARNFGITPDHVFPMADWVGGRYSVWSAIGLPVMVAVGESRFRQFLAGAHAMDEHFFTAGYRRNIPVLMALLSVWYGNFLNADGLAVAPYSHGLRRLPAWLQQLDMESSGKSRTTDGSPLPFRSGAIVFGEEGVNCQHAFFQLLHQGTRLIPCDFIVPMYTPCRINRHQRFTVANAFAQSEALMRGKTAEEVYAELAALPEAEREALVPHKIFPGNRPSNSFLFDELTPFNLGMLMASYEHKIFVQGMIWGINPFDQWGVEYGKALAKTIEPELNRDLPLHHDSSTNGLIAHYRKCSAERQQ